MIVSLHLIQFIFNTVLLKHKIQKSNTSNKIHILHILKSVPSCRSVIAQCMSRLLHTEMTATGRTQLIIIAE